MGSRFAALDLPDHLRHWHGLGLRTVYSETDLAASQAHQTPVHSARGASGMDQASSLRQAPAGRPGPPAQNPQPSARPSSDHRVLQQSERTTPKPGIAPVVPSVVTSGEVRWEEPWTTYLQRLPQPCATIWTYWELGADLSFEPHQGRRAIFARLIRKLAWPKGSVGFFPVNEARNNKLLAQGSMFWAGVNKAQAKYVFSFGRRSLMSICPDRTFRYGSVTLGDVRLFILPETEDLVREDRETMLLVWNALKSIQI